jgi:MYND finger
MMPSNSTEQSVLLIQLNKETWQDDMSSNLFTTLKSRARVIDTTTATDASNQITSLLPSTILITTADFAKKKHSALQSKVIEYTRAGGTVIICGQFCNMIRPPDFDSFFQNNWDLSWKFGNYHRTTLVPNPSRRTKLRTQHLPASYCIKAVHVKDVASEDMVYITTEDSKIQSMVFSPESAHIPDQSPILFTAFGNGFLGYIGDVNQEKDTSTIIMAMCSWECSADVVALLGDKSRCRFCLKQPAKKCARCKEVSYCTKECQKMDWKEHKKSCAPSA